MFEGIVVDILNRILGDYVENLDTSQLKIGIWGGDVLLRDLILKATALDDLDVPFKVVVGKVGTLRLRIPWKSLYSSSTELILEDLLVLVTPSFAVRYDRVAEEQAAQAAKEKEIARLDDVRARERKRKEGTKEEDGKGDSLAEKIAAQVIKNVQLKIQGIHIRYEDDVTTPERPFAFGVVLKSLNVHTTDQDWKPKVITEVVESVNKMARLEGLAVYWNSKTQLLQRLSSEKTGMIEGLKQLMEKGEKLTYILGPINSGAKVVMTPNPDRGKAPFSKPKFLVEVVMEELGVGMSNLQFQDIMALMEEFDYMSRAQHYRKHRPKEPLSKGKYKEWWWYAYACILDDVKRRRENWNWLHMKTHRDRCKVYAGAYYTKLTTRTLKPELVQILADCEKGLNVFNINLVRKQVEMYLEREGKPKPNLKGEEEAKEEKSWLSGWVDNWFSGGEVKKESGAEIMKRFTDALTPEEKAKLFSAIDYSETAQALDYPDEYLEYQLNFRLDLLTFTVTKKPTKRKAKAKRILRLAVGRVETEIATRPVRDGLRIDVSLTSLVAEGLKERAKGEDQPVKMISSKGAKDVKLLAVQFEINPLQGQASQRLWVEGEHIEIVYHGKTVVELTNCFTLPPELQAARLQAAAMYTQTEWKEQSAAGIQHLVETRGEIDLRIDLRDPYLLVPQNGLLTPSSSCLIVDLGALSIRSNPRVKHRASMDESHFDAMVKSSYDTMTIELLDFRILFALPGEGKEELVRSPHLIVEMRQSLIPEDPRYPKLQIQGSLPAFNVKFSDTALNEVIILIANLPLPGDDSQDEEPDTATIKKASVAEDRRLSQSYAVPKIMYDTVQIEGEEKVKTIIECVELVLKFSLESLTLQITRMKEKRPIPFVDFELKLVEFRATNRTFSSSTDITVEGLTLWVLDAAKAEVHTHALQLHCKLTLRQQTLYDHTNTTGTIRNLTLSTCNMSTSQEEGEGDEGVATVIQPLSITLVMNQSEEAGTLVDVNISDIFVRVTAGTLDLLLKILPTIWEEGEERKEKRDETDHSFLWDMKRNEEEEFWFLKPNAFVETGVDLLAGEGGTVRLFNLAEELTVKERLVLESGCIVFTFETGMGKGTKPMLLLEMDLDLQLWDWSGNASPPVAGRMKLEAAYYNPTFGLWEYLVEPVETRNHGRVAHQPWELLFEFSSRKGGGGGGEVVSPLTPLEEGEAAKPFTSLVLESQSILELTVSKTAWNVIDVLMADFQAASKRLVSEKKVSTVAYCVENETELDVKLVLKDGRKHPSFFVQKGGMDYDEVVLKGGTRVDLELSDAADMTKHGASFLREQKGKEERILTLEIPEFGFRREIPVNRACKRYFPLKKEGTVRHLALVCDIWVKDYSKIVTLRGVVQVQNGLDLQVDVYLKEKQGKGAKLVGRVNSGERLNLPLISTLNARAELFFAPRGFGVTTTPFSWRRALSEGELAAVLECPSKAEQGEERFYVKVTGKAQQAFHETTSRKNLTSQCCNIYLEPPLVLNNLLPVSLGLTYPGSLVLAERGRAVNVTGFEVELDGSCVLPLQIPDYNGRSWTCQVEVSPATPEISHWEFTSPSSDGSSHSVLTLGLHREENEEEKEVVLNVYCPYWMLNRTGLSLLYKGDDKHYQNVSKLTEHHSDKEQPVLFSFPGRAFFSKKAAKVRVKDVRQSLNSDWSGKFSLDTAGSGGCVSCRSPSQLFQIGVEIQLSSWGLTKYVIFTPKFYLVNQCSFQVSVREVEEGKRGGAEATLVRPNACIPFWPKSSLPHLVALVKGVQTKAFRYDAVQHTLLQLPGKWGGIQVDIHDSDQKTVVTFTEFRPGQAPVLLVNGTEDCPIQLAEDGEELGKWILPPANSQLFTWRNPLGSRLLMWGTLSEGMKTKDRLFGDGAGSLEGDGGRTYYWISFLDGTQRTLLFTSDPGLTQLLQAVKENEVATAEYVIMLSGIGLSLVDNERLREIIYLRIASSDISWEESKTSKRKRFKPLAFEVSRSVEMAYQNYLIEKAIDGGGGVNSTISLDAGIEVDFATMTVTKPQKKLLRRVFQTGIWVHYKTYPNSTQLHAKINRIQVDNQLQDTVFRVVFAPVQPPKSVALSDVPKPFAEVSIMQLMNAHSYVQQFKYFKILVQEFHVKLDGNFLNALMAMFSGTKKARQESLMAKFDSELEEACLALKDILARQIVSQGQKNFYDYLHLSPLKMHVSFSMGGSAQLSNHFLNLVLASVGVTLTEIQDVVFKLSCLEFQHRFLSGEELQVEVVAHYSSQAIKQLYVLVLGLDVLGNPFGLATGIASGVEAFFYEPIHGAIQGPGEFAEGLALGLKKLVGSTLGGAAGAVSKITGTLGKGIAALTMDDEFQRKRREGLHNRGDGAETLARSGKALVMGFVEGVTGFVTKPIRGAKEEGTIGFFKGVGKGTVGLVARPAAGVVDFASGSFDALKKCASTTVEVGRMRPPRCILPDSKLLPYVHHEAEGVQLLSEIVKGKFGKTDCYVAHALISRQFCLLLTNRRLIKLKIFGSWGLDWSYTWEEFAHPPDLVERGLSFTLRNPPKKKLNVLGDGRKEFVVPIYSAEVCFWLLSKIEEAMILETGLEFAIEPDEEAATDIDV